MMSAVVPLVVANLIFLALGLICLHDLTLRRFAYNLLAWNFGWLLAALLFRALARWKGTP